MAGGWGAVRCAAVRCGGVGWGGVGCGRVAGSAFLWKGRSRSRKLEPLLESWPVVGLSEGDVHCCLPVFARLQLSKQLAAAAERVVSVSHQRVR